jgi:hypothetical protein
MITIFHPENTIEKLEEILNFFQAEVLCRSFAAEKVIVTKNRIPFWHQTWQKNK